MTKILFVFAVLLAFGLAEVPKWTTCEGASDDVCNISEIRVTPCKDINCCKFKKRKNATIDIDFTPNFAGSNVKTGLFWASDHGDVPFAELNNADACQYTACPLEAGKKQTFGYHLYVNKNLPSGKYPLKWKLWNVDESTQSCCFKTNVEIERSKEKRKKIEEYK